MRHPVLSLQDHVPYRGALPEKDDRPPDRDGDETPTHYHRPLGQGNRRPLRFREHVVHGPLFPSAYGHDPYGVPGAAVTGGLPPGLPTLGLSRFQMADIGRNAVQAPATDKKGTGNDVSSLFPSGKDDRHSFRKTAYGNTCV